MRYNENRTKVGDLKVAYIGGGSRGWARGLMSDLAVEDRMCGTVFLYDIDYEAAKVNETIGNSIPEACGDAVKSKWKYKAVDTLKKALVGADFVVISILPGTFDKEMRSDVHAPEKYGIYQSVGDTTGPGGILRTLRTAPIYVGFAEAIKKYCPNAWVINYTNPMTNCVRTLYRTFPEIKAFGCCHEVFSTQKLLACAYEEHCGKVISREEVEIDVQGVNHFTWVTSAHYKNEDLYPIYAEFADKYYSDGYYVGGRESHWMNKSFACSNQVKFDLFKRYGVIAAAGDRHLAEFCPRGWYMDSPETVEKWGFGLTSVDWRIKDWIGRLEKTQMLLEGKEKFIITETGEEGTKQMMAILGLIPLVTNVNLPNHGQMPDLPEDVVVETNACFSSRGVQPVYAGRMSGGVNGLVQRIVHNQELTVEAALSGNYELAFRAFVNDPLVHISPAEARKLFDEMLKNTADYLPY